MDKDNGNCQNSLSGIEIVSEEVLEGLGISSPAYQEIETIIGRRPTIDELGTLMAMWQSQGKRQGLLSWLRGQPHATTRHDYLENELEPESRQVREPRVKDCIEIARHLFETKGTSSEKPKMGHVSAQSDRPSPLHRGDAIYMIGDVSLYFADSEYGRRFLHLVVNPMTLGSDEETRAYIDLILESLQSNDAIFSHHRVGSGGLFGTLLQCVAPHGLGFDILSCREVRLDAFLFGEKGVRHVAFLDETREDFLLQKLEEARVNCCFLGRVTKGRILVDDMDFGPVSRYL